ncbi:rcc01693 family protein [Yoonia sp.]|uniref:rcc01693 family protein n=1 Tax=Yoonia sp. TaxID=2212373 RepID=UPI002FDAF6F7
MDWRGLMQAGLCGLRLTPAQFWALTPVELQMMLGLSGSAAPMLRARLDDLLAAFPDEDVKDG